MNVFINGIIYFSSKNSDYLKLSLFWFSLIVNFVIQGQAQGSIQTIIYGYGFSIVPLSLLGYASLSFTDQKYPWKTTIPVALLSLPLTMLIIDMDISFTLKALPFAIASALPLIYTFYIYMIKSSAQITPLMKFHAIVILFLAIHTFNFAFFRMDPGAQLWGWPIAYALYQLLAGLLPALTIDFYYRKEEVRLQEIIELKTNELRESNVELHGALQQKKYLFRTLTHDISTPLSIARMKIRLFETKPSDIQDFTTKMSDLTLRMEQLVNQVRNFESIQSGNKQFPIREEKLISCVDIVKDMFEDRLNEKKVQLLYDHKSLSQFEVKVDFNSFTNSVLMNIISNSIKFCKEGGTIRIDANKSDEGKINLTIEDNGIGMPKHIKDNLFDFEANTSRKGTSNEPGTGFGVPIIKKILQAYGGEVEIFSEEENQDQKSFTRFVLTLNGTCYDATQVA